MRSSVQQWEYCELEVTIGGPISGIKGELWIFRSEGEHTHESGRCGELFAQLGDAGWELVGSSARTGTGLSGKHKINYIFERPKA